MSNFPEIKFSLIFFNLCVFCHKVAVNNNVANDLYSWKA